MPNPSPAALALADALEVLGNQLKELDKYQAHQIISPTEDSLATSINVLTKDYIFPLSSAFRNSNNLTEVITLIPNENDESPSYFLNKLFEVISDLEINNKYSYSLKLAFLQFIQQFYDKELLTKYIEEIWWDVDLIQFKKLFRAFGDDDNLDTQSEVSEESTVQKQSISKILKTASDKTLRIALLPFKAFMLSYANTIILKIIGEFALQLRNNSYVQKYIRAFTKKEVINKKEPEWGPIRHDFERIVKSIEEILSALQKNEGNLFNNPTDLVKLIKKYEKLLDILKEFPENLIALHIAEEGQLSVSSLWTMSKDNLRSTASSVSEQPSSSLKDTLSRDNPPDYSISNDTDDSSDNSSTSSDDSDDYDYILPVSSDENDNGDDVSPVFSDEGDDGNDVFSVSSDENDNNDDVFSVSSDESDDGDELFSLCTFRSWYFIEGTQPPKRPADKKLFSTTKFLDGNLNKKILSAKADEIKNRIIEYLKNHIFNPLHEIDALINDNFDQKRALEMIKKLILALEFPNKLITSALWKTMISTSESSMKEEGWKAWLHIKKKQLEQRIFLDFKEKHPLQSFLTVGLFSHQSFKNAITHLEKLLFTPTSTAEELEEAIYCVEWRMDKSRPANKHGIKEKIDSNSGRTVRKIVIQHIIKYCEQEGNSELSILRRQAKQQVELAKSRLNSIEVYRPSSNTDVTTTQEAEQKNQIRSSSPSPPSISPQTLNSPQ